MLKRLRWKFILINMSIVAAMLIVIFSMVYHSTKTDLDNQATAMLRSLTKTALQPGYIGEEPSGRLPYFTIVINSWGSVITSGSASFDINDSRFVEEMITIVQNSESNLGEIEEYGLRYYKAAVIGSQCMAFVDISSHNATLNALIEVSVVIGCMSVVAFFLISVLLARWAVRPVEKAWIQQKQFLSDASHELKTPLTVIMSNAELLQNPDWDSQSREQFSLSILTMAKQMRHLVEGMLELARAENGQLKACFEKLDLSKLVADGLLPFEPVFFEKQLLLESRVEASIMVSGSGQHLHQVLDILLDNAGKYSAPGTIRVTLKRQGRGACILMVDNPGTPIPPEEYKRIFQRFYRADQARSRTGSFGLGLPIAANIIREHSGRIWVESNETGNRFCVSLPVL